MTSFFILLSSIYSHSVHFQNLLRAEKLFHFKFPIDWYITLTCLSNFNFEVFFQAAIMNYAQYGVMPRCCRWGFLICVSWHLPLTLCKISALYVFFSGLGDFLANSPILLFVVAVPCWKAWKILSLFFFYVESVFAGTPNNYATFVGFAFLQLQ